MNNIEFLQKAIATIKKSGEMKGQDITSEEIAKRAGFSEKQLLTFLSGEEELPADFTTNLLSSFNFKLEPIRFEDEISLNYLEDDENEVEELQ